MRLYLILFYSKLNKIAMSLQQANAIIDLVSSSITAINLFLSLPFPFHPRSLFCLIIFRFISFAQ